jgi:trimeric autotransporter adhesin
MPKIKPFSFLLLCMLIVLPNSRPAHLAQATDRPAAVQRNETSNSTYQSPTATEVNLKAFLNADGSLNLPPEGILGSIDPTGFQLVSGPGEAPRFAVADNALDLINDDDKWDARFYGKDMNNAVHALAWDGANLYAGGEFITAGFCAGCNRVARWDGTSWNPLDNGVNKIVHTLAWDGANLFVGGGFDRLCSNTACTTTAAANGVNHIARWDGAEWHALGNGLNVLVYALIWDGANVYAGGAFTLLCSNADCTTTAPPNGVNYIARWDGTAWYALGNGVGGESAAVLALTLDGPNLYAGGSFTLLCSNMDCTTTVPANGVNRIARWDGNFWHSLDNGVNAIVYALAWDGINLYAGGDFTLLCNNVDCTTTIPANGVNRVARWDGVAWHALANGVNGNVRALVWDGANLTAGGFFTRLCSNANCTITAPANGVNRLARWNETAWSPLDNGMNSLISALAWDGTILTIGGPFSSLCGNADCSSSSSSVNRIAQWDDINWSGLSAADGQGVDNAILTLAWDGENLYAGGGFTTAGQCTDCNRIARWDGTAWRPLGYGVNQSVRALAWDGVNLYAGGFFNRLCDNTECTTSTANGVNYIARWDGVAWHSLDDGLSGLAVMTLLWEGANLYVGGKFSRLCDNADCTTTRPYSGINNIARWDGNTWHPLDYGLRDYVLALAWDGINLYAGGSFTRACDTLDCSFFGNQPPFTGANRIARWDGAAWYPLDNGVNDPVNSLVWDGANLYAGGLFTRLCSNVFCSTPHIDANGVNRIARWDGVLWHSLGNGVNAGVIGLAWDSANLYIGGYFTRLCSNANCSAVDSNVNRSARWDGTDWNSLGSGVNRSVWALVRDENSSSDSLYVGGEFDAAGGKPSAKIGRWQIEPEVAPSAAVYLPLVVR